MLFAFMFTLQAFGQIAVLPKVQVPVAAFADRFALSGTATDDGWAMVWTEPDGVSGALLDKEVKLFGTRFRVGTEQPNDQISVGWSGTRLLVAWIDQAGTLRIRRVLNGVPELEEEVIDSGPAYFPKVAGSPSGALLVWTTGAEIHAMRFNREGARIDQTPVRVDTTAAEKGRVYAGAAGEGYLIAWEEGDKNPSYPCRFNACADSLEIRMVACRLDPSGPTPTTVLRSYIPSDALDSRGPYPEGFAWSPRSGLLLWDDVSATLMIPVSEDFQSGAPVLLPNGIANAQFDGRNFVVCSYRGDAGATLLIVSQFGVSSVATDAVIPYAQVVAGFDGRALLIWTSAEDGAVLHSYVALVVDSLHFPTRRQRAVRY